MKAPYKMSSVYILLTTVIFVWGVSWPINKLGVDLISPIWFTFLRLTTGTIILFLVSFISGNFIIPTKKDLPIIFSIGILQRCLFSSLVSFGLSYSGAGQASILIYTTPILILPISSIVFKEKINQSKILGMLIGMLGIFFLINPLSYHYNDKLIMGNMILLLAALCWAGSILCCKYMKWHNSSIALVPWQMLFGNIIAMFAAYIYDPHLKELHLSLPLLWVLIFSGVIGTAFANWGTTVVNRVLPSFTVSASLLAVPVIGTLSSYFILGEKITVQMQVSLSLITCGLLIMMINKNFKKGIT